MMWSESGLMDGGSLSSASIRSISSPVSKFFTLICFKISWKLKKTLFSFFRSRTRRSRSRSALDGKRLKKPKKRKKETRIQKLAPKSRFAAKARKKVTYFVAILEKKKWKNRRVLKTASLHQKQLQCWKQNDLNSIGVKTRPLKSPAKKSRKVSSHAQKSSLYKLPQISCQWLPWKFKHRSIMIRLKRAIAENLSHFDKPSGLQKQLTTRGLIFSIECYARKVPALQFSAINTYF